MTAFGPALEPVAGDGPHLRTGRSSSAWAKYALALVGENVPRTFSRSSSLRISFVGETVHRTVS